MGVRAITTIDVPAGITRTTQAVASVDDVIYILNADGSFVRLPQDGLLTGSTVQAAAAGGYAFFVDGTGSPIEVDVTAGGAAVATVFTATEGAFPAAPTLVSVYNDRLVLAGFVGDEQNYAMSRIGDYFDFDTAQTDAAAAFAGNTKANGRCGGSIVALMPFSDDVMLFGCNHSIWRMAGDLGLGGTVMPVTQEVGVLGPNAWAQAPDGSIYFVGEHGLFRIDRSGAWSNLSDYAIRPFFLDIERGVDTVLCAWDTRYNGLWIFITGAAPADYATAPKSVHLFYEPANKAFFRVQMPAAMDPVAVTGFDGSNRDDRIVLLGARDGYIRNFDDAATTDSGVPIEARVTVGPGTPAGDIREARITGLDFILGEVPDGFVAADNWRMDWSLQVGKDADQAVNAPTESKTGTILTAGQQRPIGLKLGGSTFALKLSNSTAKKFFAMDRIVGRIVPGGRQR